MLRRAGASARLTCSFFFHDRQPAADDRPDDVGLARQIVAGRGIGEFQAEWRLKLLGFETLDPLLDLEYWLSLVRSSMFYAGLVSRILGDEYAASMVPGSLR